MMMIIVIIGIQRLLNTYYWHLSSSHVLTHTISTTSPQCRWCWEPRSRDEETAQVTELVSGEPGFDPADQRPQPDPGTSPSCWHAHTYNRLLGQTAWMALRPSHWACPAWSPLCPARPSILVLRSHPISVDGTTVHPGAQARTFSRAHIHSISC